MKIWAKTAEFSEGKYLVVRRDGTIPEWRHFVIGDFDPCAAVALRAYADKAEELGFESEYVASVREKADDVEIISAGERARKIANPTAGPHRRDDPTIVALMGGRLDSATVTIRQERAGGRPDEDPSNG